MAAGSRDRPKSSSDQPDQSQKPEKPARVPKNRLNKRSDQSSKEGRPLIFLFKAGNLSKYPHEEHKGQKSPIIFPTVPKKFLEIDFGISEDQCFSTKREHVFFGH